MPSSEQEELLMECSMPNGGMKTSLDEPVLRPVPGDISRRKTLVSLILFLLVMIVSAYVTVVVNDNRPDPSEHPPLPDVVLKSMHFHFYPGYICAASLVFLSSTFVITASLHKYRHVIFRRYFSSIAMLYLWRNVCMLVTSIPVTHTNLVCAAKTNGSFYARIKQALVIVSTLGSYTDAESTGVTCGDFMYSGHTITFIYLAFHITKYSRNLGHILHPFCWMIAAVGIFSLMASFFHYTMDVAVSLALAPLCFTLHEVLVENPSLRRKFAAFRLFYPLMNYLESDRNHLNCAVQNEYDWSLVKPALTKYLCYPCSQTKP
ncbi:sphingomyelin synthase-related protein 1-like [Ptychodera flava]|uniref:sphingomyelin synthase-related protein 1-like n=1 Tax=Ptychodera flava TaxID=63121 RepID=UPI003969E1B0